MISKCFGGARLEALSLLTSYVQVVLRSILSRSLNLKPQHANLLCDYTLRAHAHAPCGPPRSLHTRCLVNPLSCVRHHDIHNPVRVTNWNPLLACVITTYTTQCL